LAISHRRPCALQSLRFFRYAIRRLHQWLGLEGNPSTLDPHELLGQLQELLAIVAQLPAQPAGPNQHRVLFLLDGLEEIERLDASFPRLLFSLPRRNVALVCAGRPEGSLPEVFAPDRCVHMFSDGLPAMSESDIRAMLIDGTASLKYDLLALRPLCHSRHPRIKAAVWRSGARFAGIPSRLLRRPAPSAGRRGSACAVNAAGRVACLGSCAA